MAALLFDFAQVEEYRQGVLSTAAALAGHIAEMDDAVRRASASWSGTAADNFATTYAAWRQAAAAIHEDLGYLHQIVCTSQGNFASAQSAVQTIWGDGA
ncbi:hypothetical protein GXW83_12555 [Streptacidiphilus sp. PB12-B1b]|uniref:WXG100 family type VII secretion target n=1 Tax=Streptacidiphilus sp. PB12-B1b TaxID=2705012 RepID=UPI0015F9F9A6|nr:hypothetical protein [Streptacidiphilus sp. PB12-B1b]QMU76447.1 hypothetical protein GXW83_12555 [Streptacidiphilus sp. PB12-B1b]